ncbi:hypothetical protein C8J57DRAFT_1505021 [Mycena rebaudengoi]|nr:hypothetical protein C8J57DRAFT_1505021 [Mycena rebaudengoi]
MMYRSSRTIYFFASTTESAARSYSATFCRSSRSRTAGLIPLTPVPSLPGSFDPTADFIIINISLLTVSLTDTCCSCRASATRASQALMRKGQLARTGEKLRFQGGDAADEVRNTEYDVSAAVEETAAAEEDAPPPLEGAASSATEEID